MKSNKKTFNQRKNISDDDQEKAIMIREKLENIKKELADFEDELEEREGE